jgi:hypothetical protein
MNSYRSVIAAMIAATALAAGQHKLLAQTRVNWIGPAGIAHAWDEGDLGLGQGVNWQSGTPPQNLQPDGAFGEYGSISNGSVALINHAIVHSPTDIRLAEDAASTGSLQIQAGGSITVAATGSGAGTLANGFPGGGAGRLELRQNIGAVSIERYSQNTNSTLVVQLINAAAFNPVQVSNSIAVNGTLRVERSAGSTLTVTNGASWTLMQGAPATGAFSNIQIDSKLQSNPGQVFVASAAGNALTVSVAQRLVLEVDRFTGATTLRNPPGHSTGVSLIGYTMSSPTNGVSSAGSRWSPFSGDVTKPGWFQANPTSTQLSELNPQGSLTMTSGAFHNFGTPINANAAAPLGTNRVDTADVTFQYQAPTGELLDAIVQPVGRINDLVLVVNPATGASIIQNQSSFSLQMIGYTISSASGSLNTSWTGLQGLPLANWFKANPSPTNLSELDSSSPTPLSVGTEFALGNAWNAAGTQDLAFQYQTPDGVLHDGAVFYGAKAVLANADFNGDTLINGSDFLVWQRGVGLSGQTNNQNGDANGDGSVNAADLTVWKSQFGTSISATPSVATVPEPATGSLAALVVVGALTTAAGRKQQVRRHAGSDQ